MAKYWWLNEVYLGDAVFASFDGYQIRLRTDDGNNQVIYLEPEVLKKLMNYADNVFSKDRQKVRDYETQ